MMGTHYGLGKRQRALLRRIHAERVWNCTLSGNDRRTVQSLAAAGLALKSDGAWILSIDGLALMEGRAI